MTEVKSRMKDKGEECYLNGSGIDQKVASFALRC